MLKAYEKNWQDQTPTTSVRQLNPDGRQVRDLEESREDWGLFRAIVGSGTYLCHERYDVAFTVKELASRMTNPTTMSFHHLKKFLGYLKKTVGFLLSSSWFSTRGLRRSQIQTGGNKSHRTSISGGFHALSSCPLFNSSSAQKIVSLSSCEEELRAIVSSASDGIYILSVLEFAFGTKVDRYIFTDFSSPRQLVMKRGVGKVRHLDGKCGFRTEKISIWYKYQQTATWQTSGPNHLDFLGLLAQ